MAKLGGTQDDLAVSLSLIFHLLLYSSFRLSRFENLTIMGGYWFRLSAEAKRCRGVTLCRWTFALWQDMQVLTQFLISLRMPGQTKRCEINFKEALIPG